MNAILENTTLCFHSFLHFNFHPLQSTFLYLRQVMKEERVEQYLHSLPCPFAFVIFNRCTVNRNRISHKRTKRRDFFFLNSCLPYGREVQEIISTVAVAQFAHFGQRCGPYSCAFWHFLSRIANGNANPVPRPKQQIRRKDTGNEHIGLGVSILVLLEWIAIPSGWTREWTRPN